MRRLTHLRKPLLWLVLLLVVFPVSALAGGGTGYGQAPPTNSTAPSISGSAIFGQTLTGNAGTWSGVSLSYAYQWLRCDSAGNACAAIAGAGAASYPTASADVGQTLRFAVTATNKNGAVTVSSNPSSVVAPPPASPAPPQNTALPQISGVAQSGQTLTGSAGTWSGSPTSYGYQWQRCDSVGANCANVVGATSTSYGLGTVDVGATLRFRVSATNLGGTTSASSGATTAVASAPVAPGSAPANTALPQVTGTAQVGQTLTTSNGTWSGTPTSYAYQWRRCDSAGANCANVLGATTTTYKLATGDAAATFRANVTATNGVGSSTAASPQTAAVAAAPPAPSLNGRFGIAAGGGTQNYSATDLARYLDAVKASGSQWLRIDFNWAVIQSGGPASYNWTPFDNVVNGARARGLTVLGTIQYTPGWARAAGTSGTTPPTNLNDYATFARTVAQHYGPAGVHAYEIWNEPNISAFWAPGPDPAKYTQMLKLAYAAIKQVDPSATVISAGLSPYGSYGQLDAQHMNPVTFLQNMYANGAAGSLDAVGWHPYNFPYGLSFYGWSGWSQMAETSPSARSIMTAAGDGAKQIWATEFGWPTGSSTRAVSEAVQAQMVTDSYAKLKTWSWAGPAFFYSGRDVGTDLLNIEDNFGIIHNNWSLKLSYAAYQSAAAAG
jgi:polysaccharide biosynthesis protein PslG